MKVLYILLALAVLLVLITVHELGHYIAGKVLGFKINEFSIGFGPALYKRKKKDGEIFAVRALPLGGFCAFEGEDEDGKDNPEAFNNRPAWKRLIVLVSGVAFNFLFAVLTSAIYLMVTGYSTPQVTRTISKQNVETLGLKSNDIVLAVDGKNVEAYRSFSDMISKYELNEEFVVTVDRNGKIMDVLTKKQKMPAYYFINSTVEMQKRLFVLSDGKYVKLSDNEIDNLDKQLIATVTDAESKKEAGTGVAIKPLFENYYYKISDQKYVQLNTDENFNLLMKGDEDKKIYPLITYSSKDSVGLGIIQTFVSQKYGFFECLGKGWAYSFYLGGLIIESFIGLFTGVVAVSEAGGTITAISQMADISSWGIEFFLLLLPLLAMNLAVLNILPIPALDGARAVFVLIEMIFRKPVNRKVEGWIHTIGLFVLFGLAIFLDVNHFISASNILLNLRI